MPYKLDEIDIALLKSLFKDARKSFRQVSREIHVSTPTVKARYQRLVNVGLIKGVFPTLDLGKLEGKARMELEQIRGNSIRTHNVKINNNMMINLSCDFCKGPVSEKPIILKFGTFERFFCCTSCRSLYKDKHKGRIASLSFSHSKMV